MPHSAFPALLLHESLQGLPIVRHVPTPRTPSTSFPPSVVSPLPWVVFLPERLTRPTFLLIKTQSQLGQQGHELNSSLLLVVMRTKDDVMFWREQMDLSTAYTGEAWLLIRIQV